MSYRAQNILWSPSRQRVLPEEGACASGAPFSALKITTALREAPSSRSRKCDVSPRVNEQPTRQPDPRDFPTRDDQAKQGNPKGPNRAQGPTVISVQPPESVEAGDTREKVVPPEKHSERVETGLRLPPEPSQPSCPLSLSLGTPSPLPRGERKICLSCRGLSCPEIFVPGIRAPVHDRLSTVSSRHSVHEELDDSTAMRRSYSLVSRSCMSERGWGQECMVGCRVRDPPRQGHQCGEYK